MFKLQMLPPRLKELDTANPRGLQTVDSLKRKPLTLGDIRTKRFTSGKNGRLLPLNSEAWYRLRRMVLNEQPLCPECQARDVIEPATQVHHRNDNAMDNSRENLVGLCAPCHSRHTAADMGKRVMYGCDTTGNPADPSHHWNKPSLSRSGASGGLADDCQKSPATNSAEPTGTSYVNANRTP